MLRVSRVLHLGKNSPLITQHALCLTEQISVQYSISPVNRKASIDVPDVLDTNKLPKRLVEPFKEIKFSFLREIFQGDPPGVLGNKRDLAIKDFLQALASSRPPDIIKVLKYFVHANTRPSQSLKVLCSVITSNLDWNYTLMECFEIIYCIAKLSYKDHAVTKVLVEKLKEFEDFKSPKIASDILLSLSELRYRDPELLSKLYKYIVCGIHKPKVSVTAVKAACTLNYLSPEVDYLFQGLSSFLEVDHSETVDYLNFMWSCMLLNRLNSIKIEHLQTVLSENFTRKLFHNRSNPSVKWKLLNINGKAKTIPSYSGPFLDGQPYFKNMTLTVPKYKSSFMHSVLDVLTHISPTDIFIKSYINTGAGFYLDFEFFEAEKKAALKTDNGKQRLGLMLLNFNDVCSDGTLTGVAEFKNDLLRKMGCKIVLLRYSDYNHMDPLSLKITILKNKIVKELIEGDEKFLQRFKFSDKI